MKKLILLFALLSSAAGATNIYDPVGGGVVTLTNAADTAAIAISGTKYATVLWVVNTAGSGGITAEYTTDAAGLNSVNWLTPPYSKRTDVLSANPAVTPWTNNTPVAGTYETPLGSNVTAFRIRYQTAGTATTITVIGGLPYVPGVRVTAVIYDVTSAGGAASDTGTLDLSGWSAAVIKGFESGVAGGFLNVSSLDDAGAIFGTSEYGVALATAVAVYVHYGVAPLAGPTRGATIETLGQIPKRARVQIGAIAAITGRIRIEARR